MIRRMTINDVSQIAALEKVCFSDPWSEMRYYNTESRICLQNIDLFVFCVYNQIEWEIYNEREFFVASRCKLW